jgi:glycosyltransferase involved in cell wall biosynthesis
MRILHVAEAFGGGLMEMVCTVAEGSTRAGHEVAIAYGHRPETPAYVTDVIPAGVDQFALPWRRRTPGDQVAAARELRRLAARWRPDLVHLHSSVAGVVGRLAVGSSAPAIFSPHSFESVLPTGSRSRRAAIRALERWAVRKAALVGAVSPSEGRLSRELGATAVAVVENGIAELEPGRVLERDLPRRPRVVALGRTVPQRRPDACARILARVAESAEVVWVGGGGGRRGVAGQAALRDAGVPTTGWVPRERALDELGRATVYLHWTAWDGQPLSVLEAMARDAVVIASDIEPNRDVLGADQVFASEEAAVSAIQRVLAEPGYAEALRTGQRERRGRWAASAMVEGWLGIYERFAATDETRQVGVDTAQQGS